MVCTTTIVVCTMMTAACTEDNHRGLMAHYIQIQRRPSPETGLICLTEVHLAAFQVEVHLAACQVEVRQATCQVEVRLVAFQMEVHFRRLVLHRQEVAHHRLEAVARHPLEVDHRYLEMQVHPGTGLTRLMHVTVRNLEVLHNQEVAHHS
jgi:hypothetical protein